jgi:hypothetical protein
VTSQLVVCIREDFLSRPVMPVFRSQTGVPYAGVHDLAPTVTNSINKMLTAENVLFMATFPKKAFLIISFVLNAFGQRCRHLPPF